MAKRLHTEADVRRLPQGSELVLGPGDIVTPAALDLAFQRGIPVCRPDGPGGPGRPDAPGTDAPPRSASWQNLLARDGTYVVEVRAGRARVFRLTDEGPVPVSTT